MKLLIAGLALLAAATGMALFTYFTPATLFIGGAVCTFVGVIDLIARPGTGVAMSAGDVSEANSLANIQKYGSADGTVRFIDHAS